MTRLLQQQLTDLADSADAAAAPHADLLAGALSRATRHRRRRTAGVGIAALGVVAVAVAPVLLPLPWTTSGSTPAASSPRPSEPWFQNANPPSTGPTPPAADLPKVLGHVERASALVFHGAKDDAVDGLDAVDAATGRRQPLLRFPTPGTGTNLAFPNTGSLSPDGTKLALPLALFRKGPAPSSGIWVLDLPSGENKVYDTHDQPIIGVRWADAGRLTAHGSGEWVLDLGSGDFGRLGKARDGYLFWNGTGGFVNGNGSNGGWDLLDGEGRIVRRLPKLAPYGAGTAWTPSEANGLSPGGTWLGVQRRELSTTRFAAVDVETGRLARTWGPFYDGLNTQNVLGWSDPGTMLVMLRPQGAGRGIQLWELDVATGGKHLRASYDDATSVYVPANGS